MRTDCTPERAERPTGVRMYEIRALCPPAVVKEIKWLFPGRSGAVKQVRDCMVHGIRHQLPGKSFGHEVFIPPHQIEAIYLRPVFD